MGFAAVEAAIDAADQTEAVGADADAARLMDVGRADPGAGDGDDVAALDVRGGKHAGFSEQVDAHLCPSTGAAYVERRILGTSPRMTRSGLRPVNGQRASPGRG